MSEMNYLKTVTALTTTFIALGLFGCSVFLPAHPNSFRTKQERVVIEMLTDKTMSTDEQLYWTAADARDRPGPTGPPLIAAAAVGLAIDIIVTQLQNEATVYEAQFSATRAFSGFWQTESERSTESSSRRAMTVRTERIFRKSAGTSDFPTRPDSETKTEIDEDRSETLTAQIPKLTQRYKGFRVIRTVQGNDEKDPAFKLIVGFLPSDDQQMFRIAPLLFHTKRAKAKVLADQFWTWLPPMVFGKLFRGGGHEIDTTIDIRLEALWRGKDQLLHSTTVAAEAIRFTSYDIAKTPPICMVRCAETPGGPSGWLVGVPVSYDEKGAPVGDGTFTLKVLVTERDKSNAKRFLEHSVTYLKEHKTDIMDRLRR